MEIINYQNPNKVKYFDLFDYISNIKINSETLEHMESTNEEFAKYMKRIKLYNYNSVTHMWLIETANELSTSAKIERHYIRPEEYLKKNLYYETLEISHKRIHNLHNFVLDDQEDVFEYRKNPARVSYFEKDGTEKIYWHAAEPEDIEMFMDTFIDIYKSDDVKLINSNPFLKSALIKLLFIRIHPYGDGNGRTSRVLYNMKFTELINKIYGTDLRLCPLNISTNILMYQPNYVQILDSIYFDLEHDNNEYINKWFNFILNMCDEQLYYLSTKEEELENTYQLYKTLDKDKFNKILQKILEDIRKLDNTEDFSKMKQKILEELI